MGKIFKGLVLGAVSAVGAYYYKNPKELEKHKELLKKNTKEGLNKLNELVNEAVGSAVVQEESDIAREKLEEVKAYEEKLEDNFVELSTDADNVLEEVQEDVEEKVEEATEEVVSVVEDVQEEVAPVVENIQDAVEEVKEEAESVLEETQDSADEVKEEVVDKAEDIQDAVEEKIEDVSEFAKDAQEEAQGIVTAAGDRLDLDKLTYEELEALEAELAAQAQELEDYEEVEENQDEEQEEAQEEKGKAKTTLDSIVALFSSKDGKK